MERYGPLIKLSVLAAILTLALGAFVWSEYSCISAANAGKRLSPLYPAIAAISSILSVTSCAAMLAV